jgi:hypothetical protein
LVISDTSLLEMFSSTSVVLSESTDISTILF